MFFKVGNFRLLNINDGQQPYNTVDMQLDNAILDVTT